MQRKRDLGGLLLFGVAFLVIALDQYTKYLVREYLPLNVSWNPIPWLDPFVTLTYTRNTGAAFGLFPGSGVIFIAVAALVAIGIIVYYRQLSASSWVLRLAFGLQLGGAAGNNLIDRLFRGYVTDFIDIRIWPIFNVADSAVVVGTILLGYYALFMDRASKDKPSSTDEPQAAQSHDQS